MDNQLKHTIDAVERLVQLFRTERMVYLIITVICIIVLITTAVFLLLGTKTQSDAIAIMSLFSSSGGIMYSSGRLLKMWSEAMQLVHKVIEQ